jgi:hypothetical protein
VGAVGVAETENTELERHHKPIVGAERAVEQPFVPRKLEWMCWLTVMVWDPAVRGGGVRSNRHFTVEHALFNQKGCPQIQRLICKRAS